MEKAFKIILKSLLWIMLGCIGLVLIVLGLLYIPAVQDFAVPRVLEMINKPGEMEISLSRFRLRFPLDITVDSVRMTTPALALSASQASVDIALSPLFTGAIVADEISLDDTDFRLGTPDSAFYMNASLDRARLDGARVLLASQDVRVSFLSLDSGLVEMAIRPDTVPPAPKDTTAVNWHILLDKGELSRISYNMSIEPTITDLSCYLTKGTLTDTDVSMASNTVKVGALEIDKVDAKYIYPTPEYLADHPIPEAALKIKEAADTLPSTPWTVTCDRLALHDSHALYAMNGAAPISPNLDLSYIEASEINIEIDSLRNRAAEIYLPIKRISARERCGVPLELKGLFEMDSVAMKASGMTLTTPSSSIALDAMMGMDSVMTDLPFMVDLTGEISNDDIRRLVPAGLSTIADGLPRGVPLYLRADASGTMADIEAREISLSIPRHLSIAADGHIRDVMNLDRAVGNLTLKGAMPDGSFLKPTLMDARMARQINLPPMTIDGDIEINRGDYAADIEATAGDGSLALTGAWRSRVKGYNLTLDTDRFPLQSILPTLGISNVTASVILDGQGLDPFSPKTDIDASVDLTSLGYHGVGYTNITAEMNLGGGMARINATSANPGADFTLRADGNLAGDTLRWNFDGDFRNINLQTLRLSDSIADGRADISGTAAFTLPKSRTVRFGRRRVTQTTPMSLDADIKVGHLYWRMPGVELNTSDILAKVATDSARTMLDIDNGNLCLRFDSPESLDTLMARLNATTAILDKAMAARNLPVDTLQRALPRFTLNLDAGDNNILHNYLGSSSDIAFDTISVTASNDSLINATALLNGIVSGKTRLDSITIGIHQHNNILRYNATLDNKPGSFDQFAHVRANGYIGADRFSLIFHQQDIDDKTGYSFGSVLDLSADDTVTLRFVPYHPIIGYKDWEINRDNFLSYNLRTHHIDGNIFLENPSSSLRIFTDHEAAEATHTDSIGGHNHGQEPIHLQVTNLKIEDWLAINPFAPPMKGNLSADMTVTPGEKSLDGSGVIGLKDFYYGKEKVGDFDLDVNLATNASGTIRATTALMVDGVKTIEASGNLNDSTSATPFLLDFRMIHFPLSVVNPFLPQGMAKIHGMLNAEMDITGDMSAPIFNGWVQFDTTNIAMQMFGTDLDFPRDSIPVKDNIITFDNYDIMAQNENPLVIDGKLDISSLANIGVDLKLTAHETQIVNSKRRRGQDLYGKAYVDLDASVKGSLSRYLLVNAMLKILPGTNVTYVIPDVQAAIASRNRQEMVKFVNFADTAAVAVADSILNPGLALNLNATVEISEGSTIAVDLSSDGKNRAQIQASGRVNYVSDFLGDERMTGRINLNQGYVRYSMPPVLSEKLFNIREGSYVIFNGQMMNPQLNLHAYDEIKANVTTDGNSRMATFDVGLSVTGSLEQMNVAFDLSTDDDLTVQNELQSMSPDQRANQAMNLLLYGSYTGPGTSASTMGNPLYSFLEGQLNNLASSAIKGVDISFGIDQLSRTRDGVNSSAMSYSYRVSKSLFDDRFKIVVGGNYTTDVGTDENFAQNLIADISFEYLLNPQGTMLVRLFRHTGYESILEGEITQTGVGFVYKKKLGSLADLFNWLRPRRKEEAEK